jgi:integrase
MALYSHRRDSSGTVQGVVVARSIRSSALENRTQRLKLAPRWKPYTVRVAPGVRLGYRRREVGGGWSVIAADGKGGNWLKAFAHADDYETANGETVLDFWQAQDRARVLARGGGNNPDSASDTKPATVSEALDHYEADLRTRGGDVANVARVRTHLLRGLRQKPVALLTARELRRWRDMLKHKVSAGSINRIANGLRAALNLAANTDERIASSRAWEIGLQAIPDAVVSRNVILPAEAIRCIVAEAYVIGPEFGLLVETAATTGARVGQLARLEVHDVQRNRADPRLMMPSSRKGRGHKSVTRRPVPIPESLAMSLRHAGKQKSGDSLLLVKPSGAPWKKSDHSRLFRRAVQRARLDPAKVTIYALRHSNIVRQLLAGVPTRVVCTNHDTSVGMIEKTYSKHIGDHSDALARPTLLDLSAAPTDNVVPLAKAKN